MKKSVKVRIILFFITAVLSILSGIAGPVSLVLLMHGIVGVLFVKICLTANVIIMAIAIALAHNLLNLPKN